MHTTTFGIAETRIGSTEDKGTPNLFDSQNKTNLLLDKAGQQIRFYAFRKIGELKPRERVILGTEREICRKKIPRS